MGERDKNRRGVVALALRRLESMNKAGIRTTYEREYAEAAKVARDTDASDSDRRRGMASNIEAKRRKADAAGEAAERRAFRAKRAGLHAEEKDTSSRPGETKAQWLARMRGDYGWTKKG